MPGMDGLTALPAIREASPESEVVVLTASGTEENLLAAIRAGAAGYLLKSEPPERIADFLRGVAGRRGRALGLGRAAACSSGSATAVAWVAACRTRSRSGSRPARSRCCCCSTST